MRSALDEDILTPEEIVARVGPEVMASHLPPALMSQLLSKSLSAGAMKPEHVVSVLNPEILCEHIPHELIWECIAEAADRAGMTRPRSGLPEVE